MNNPEERFPDGTRFAQLTCCKPGCDNKRALTPEGLRQYDHGGRVLYCTEHDRELEGVKG